MFWLFKKKIFLIQDEMHCERQWEFKTFNEAFLEIERRSKILFNVIPNRCPCTSWKTCSRIYVIIEHENWVEVDRKEILDIWHEWLKWLYKIDY